MWFSDNQLITLNNKLSSKSNWVSDELTFNPSDSRFISDRPMLLWKRMQMNYNQVIILTHKLTPRLSRVIDELTFNTSDSDDAPGNPIRQSIHIKSITNLI